MILILPMYVAILFIISLILIIFFFAFFAILDEPLQWLGLVGAYCGRARPATCSPQVWEINTFITAQTYWYKNNTVQSVCTVCVSKDQPSDTFLLPVGREVVGWRNPPGGRDQPESWRCKGPGFLAWGTLISTHPRSRAEQRGLGVGPRLPGPKPRLGSGGQRAGQHWPELFGASWAWRGPWLEGGLRRTQGASHLPQPPRCSPARQVVPGLTRKGLQQKVETHWNWPYSCWGLKL